MDHFQYKDGVLYAEEVAIPQMAAAIGTPFYCYSTATLVRHYRVMADAFSAVPTQICFAVKANSNLAVLKTLAAEGAGADVVSEGEIRRALAAGIAPEKIVFSGMGKTRAELRYALEQNIGQFNVESAEELQMLSEEALALGVTAPIALRVNPDVDANTHEKITTGRKEDKFGVAWEAAPALYDAARELEGVEVIGMSTHIGSQLTDLAPFKQAFSMIEELVQQLRAAGHSIRRLDLGGGLGIPYDADGKAPPEPDAYSAMVLEAVQHLECELVLEPGRVIAGNAGILVSQVLLVKRTGTRNFLVLDAGMNDLLRPSMYDAHHDIIPVVEATGENEQVDIVGPVCETADRFAQGRTMPVLQEGDLVAIRSAGAYGAVMASTYNSRMLVPEVLVKDAEYAVVRPRQSYAELLGQDQLPEWL